MLELGLFFVSCFITLFSVLDPFGAAVTMLALTHDDTEESRASQAYRASRASLLILLFFTFVGGYIFALFGVSIHALLIAGGLILLQVAFRMLEGQSLTYRSTRPEQEEGEKKEDIAIIPLAIPIMAGPAAITTVSICANKSDNIGMWVMLIMAVTASIYLTYLILKNCSTLTKLLGETGVRVLVRAMGLILMAMGVEFILSGIDGYFIQTP